MSYCRIKCKVEPRILTCNVPLFQFNSKRPKRKATSASIKPVRKKQKSELDSDDEDIESGKLKGTEQAITC